MDREREREREKQETTHTEAKKKGDDRRSMERSQDIIMHMMEREMAMHDA